MSRAKVFVSYSYDDREWLNKFSVHIAVLERRGLMELWSDERITAGSDWEREIEAALGAAKVAVLMVSPAFLASNYIWKYEMPRIMTHLEQGMDILPLILRPCAWRLEEDLARLQARPTDGRPLSLGSESEIDTNLCEFAYELAARVGKSPAAIAPTDAANASTSGPVSKPPDVAGLWRGHYNGSRPVNLLIREMKKDTFEGQMEYLVEGTATRVEGVAYEQWSPDDPAWVQIGGASRGDDRFIVRFCETDYETRGSSTISFNGEYRAVVKGDEMTGAWFSNNRLVGSLTLRRLRK